MEDLKKRLEGDLAHVETVYFDTDGNWYLHKGVGRSAKSRDEILTGEIVETKKKKIKE